MKILEMNIWEKTRGESGVEDYQFFINKLPSEQPPNIFGFNENG